MRHTVTTAPSFQGLGRTAAGHWDIQCTGGICRVGERPSQPSQPAEERNLCPGAARMWQWWGARFFGRMSCGAGEPASPGHQRAGGWDPAGPRDGRHRGHCHLAVGRLQARPRCSKQGAHDLGLDEQQMLQIRSGKHCRATGGGERERELSEQHPGSCKCS